MRTDISFKRILILIVITAGILTCILSINEKASAPSDILSEKDILKAQYTRGTMQQQLSDDNIYPVYYTSRKIFKMNNKDIREGLIKDNSIKWFAQENNIYVSDKELSAYMTRLTEESQAAEEYETYDAAARSLGSTYENIVMNDSETYRNMLIREKLYSIYISETDKTGSINQDSWDKFTENIIDRYKNDHSYITLLEDLKTCQQLYDSDITDIKQIRSVMER